MRLIHVVASMVVAVAAMAAEPKLDFPDGTTLDYGRVDAGVTLTDSIRIHNAGDAPLVITRTFAGCACTMPDEPREPIAPGADAWIKVRFDTSGRTPGGFLKIVTVRSNDPRGQLTFFVKGTVRRPRHG